MVLSVVLVGELEKVEVLDCLELVEAAAGVVETTALFALDVMLKCGLVAEGCKSPTKKISKKKALESVRFFVSTVQ